MGPVCLQHMQDTILTNLNMRQKENKQKNSPIDIYSREKHLQFALDEVLSSLCRVTHQMVSSSGVNDDIVVFL